MKNLFKNLKNFQKKSQLCKIQYSSLNKQYSIGQFPNELRYDREYQKTTLSNGIQVCTEYWPSKITTAALFINCGSRNETLETSGSAHFLEHLHFKGTQKRSRFQLELDVENMGGQLNAYTSRENTSYTMTVFQDKLRNALEILSDMMLNSKYDKNELEIERHTIKQELIETQKEQMETLVEFAHSTSYNGHMMAEPILGSIHNIENITQDMVKEYHYNNYYGENLVIVGVGELNHQNFVSLCEEYFGKMKKNTQNSQTINLQKPVFHNQLSLKYQDYVEEQPSGVNLGVFYEAPSWLDDDYFAFLLIQRLMADKPNHQLEAQLYGQSQINSFQKQLQQFPEIEQQRSVYTPYLDTGLFGNFYYGDPNQFDNMLKLTKQNLLNYCKHINEQELERAKNVLFMELFQHETQNDISQAIGNQILYFGRRVSRTEIAQRVALYSPQLLSEIATKWFQQKSFSITAWGNIENLLERFDQK